MIKAALVFNLSKFVSCQGEHPTNGEPYTLCIIGDDDTLPAFAELDGKVLQGSKFVVRCEPEEAELAACRIIYFCDSDADRIETLIASLGDSPVLTVSTAEDFIENGGIIQLVKVRKKFRFRINPAAAERAGLKLSSQLLKIADIASR